MNREDLTKLFKLQSAIMGIGIGAVALGLWYANTKDDCKNTVNSEENICLKSEDLSP